MSSPPSRGPGRPRSARAHEAILQATLELLAERGLAALTIEAVATRAGVGKATVYRRWSSKPDLVREAVARIGTTELPLPDTGSVRGDVVALAHARRDDARETRANFFIPRLLAEAAQHPELAELFRATLVQPARDRVAIVLRRGIERGELRPDIDIETAVDLLLGPLSYRLIYSGGDLSVLDELPGRLVDAVLPGLAARD